MHARVTIADIKVEIEEHEVARLAAQLVRKRFELGDATDLSPDGRLRAWRRDERGKPEPFDGALATEEQRAALRVLMGLLPF